jgi:antitoxin HigA-1
MPSDPTNRLEALKGDRKGYYSIRINDQWRICFRWTSMGPKDVEIVDYQREQDMPKQDLTVVATLPSLHPGEVLREEFLMPTELTPYAVAKACGVPRTRIERIAREHLGISADTALRLGRFFGVEPEFWLNLQTSYDLETAKAVIGPSLERIASFNSRAA